MGVLRFAGGKPAMEAPISGILASELAVGSVVKLMEDGVATEYLVVNQGKPSGSSLYDDSCNGTWLLRKMTTTNVVFSARTMAYRSSSLASYLDSTFYNTLGVVEQSIIKQVKIPCLTGDISTDVGSGSNGFLCRIFALSAVELGMVQEGEFKTCDIEGSKLSYFVSGNNTNEANEKRVVSEGNNYYSYNTRTISMQYSSSESSGPFVVTVRGITYGALGFGQGAVSVPIRPALILPSTALFDKDTMILKGVA